MKNENQTTESKIEYIRIELLEPHPDNPRKDVGDVTELAESIKANGILQNLTVVPYKGMFRVIIGHRRLAAAKIADLDELPCVVVDMTEKEQISTMLTENMQRVDLSIYEQAQGFQMMLDMGDTMDEIADKSGFSKTTVRKRLEIAKLDGAALKKATDTRQVTMADFDRLAEIEDIEVRNKLLSSIGTPNFKNDLTRALQDQKTKHRIVEWLEVVKTFATEIKREELDRDKTTYVRNYSWYSLSTEVQVPADAAEVKYYYLVCSNEIDIYKERNLEKEEAEQAARDERRRLQDEERERWNDINYRHFGLRRLFLAYLSNAVCKKHFGTIALFVAETIRQGLNTAGYYRRTMDLETLSYVMDAGVVEDANEAIADVYGLEDNIKASPEKAMLCLAYSSADNDGRGYWESYWDSNSQNYKYRHKESDILDGIYKMLTALGYEMSDEEKQMQNGNHPAFETEEE